METDEKVQEETPTESGEMCCKGDGKTAAQHRHESEDGKCCVDK